MPSAAIQGLKTGFLKMGDLVILISAKTGTFEKVPVLDRPALH